MAVGESGPLQNKYIFFELYLFAQLHDSLCISLHFLSSPFSPPITMSYTSMFMFLYYVLIDITHQSLHYIIYVKCMGTTVRYLGGGGLEFLPDHFYLFHKGEMKVLFFSPQDRLEICISIFILHLFQRPLWIKYLFPLCLVAIYLFQPFFLKK